MQLGLYSIKKQTLLDKNSNSNKAQNRENKNSINGLHRSLFLYNSGHRSQPNSILIKNENGRSKLRANKLQNTINTFNIDQINQQRQSATEIMKQLNLSYFYAVCQNFEQTFKIMIDQMLNKFLTLEYKIAQCQKKFNAIQFNLHQKSMQIGTVIQQNRILIQLNRDIQIRMEQLRQKYQISYATMKNQWISNKIEQFKNQLLQFKITNKQCESCQKAIKERLRKQISKLQQNSIKYNSSMHQKQGQKDRLTNSNKIVKDTLKQILQMICQAENNRNSSEFIRWKQKLLENIDLKFQILRLCSLQVGISKSNQKQSLKKSS